MRQTERREYVRGALWVCGSAMFFIKNLGAHEGFVRVAWKHFHQSYFFFSTTTTTHTHTEKQ